ncbi:sugar transferase [Parapedobacter koreensis]|uniref:Sugar transferase involved in LPS biosynthesis (Colanic, teichoic acid) n=1 Tax=Parapedobacter koreensis TaxID=332977 RepID=A0A1H7IJR2_9SPHI|nr:sugar transferase [Parapedobacter koreensis]SEK62574.1 Sugar transferase involved in LPS biosynthesis (colanic, teichoic acid) [Parapedobacter koreensis]
MDLLKELRQQHNFITISAAYFGGKFADELYSDFGEYVDITLFDSLTSLRSHLHHQSLFFIPDVVILEIEDNIAEIYSFIVELKTSPITRGISVVLLGFKNNKEVISQTFRPYVDDIYFYPFNAQNIRERLFFIFKFKLITNKPLLPDHRASKTKEYKTPFMKRLFDVLVSSILIVLFSPVFLIVMVLIKLDSKGPIFYKSKRAGSGYKIFDFYKFRSMKVNADKELDKLAVLNQYNGQSAFIKIKNDPRVTRLGAFLRKTSLDELPQLFNVLKGDMSLVGNRPLPLYEAQMLTSDEWAMRFLGPAGITGLWQVSKRGKSEMSDAERRQLDNQYAQYYSFSMDLRIMLLTIPAMIQSERV